MKRDTEGAVEPASGAAGRGGGAGNGNGRRFGGPAQRLLGCAFGRSRSSASQAKRPRCGPRCAGPRHRIRAVAPTLCCANRGPCSPSPIPRRFAAAPDSGPPFTRHVIGALPKQNQSHHEPVEGGSGWVGGALSAMDGAKRGRRSGCCRPRQLTPTRQQAALRLLTLPWLEKAGAGHSTAQLCSAGGEGRGDA